jgi:hypothetical protein
MLSHVKRIESSREIPVDIAEIAPWAIGRVSREFRSTPGGAADSLSRAGAAKRPTGKKLESTEPLDQRSYPLFPLAHPDLLVTMFRPDITMIDPPPLATEPVPIEAPPGRWWHRSAGPLERIALIAMALGGALLLYLSWRMEPDPRGFGTHEQLGLAPCSFRTYAGIPCLSCGMTTAFSLMMRLRWIDAIVVQPAGAMIFVSILAFIPLALWASIRGRSLLHALDRLPLAFFAAPYPIVLLGAWAYTIYRSRDG